MAVSKIDLWIDEVYRCLKLIYGICFSFWMDIHEAAEGGMIRTHSVSNAGKRGCPQDLRSLGTAPSSVVQ